MAKSGSKSKTPKTTPNPAPPVAKKATHLTKEEALTLKLARAEMLNHQSQIQNVQLQMQMAQQQIEKMQKQQEEAQKAFQEVLDAVNTKYSVDPEKDRLNVDSREIERGALKNGQS